MPITTTRMSTARIPPMIRRVFRVPDIAIMFPVLE
jgi:hypothetical protein